MAGLLTSPRSALPSQPCPRPVTFSKQTLCFEGITAAGTVPDSHRIPLHRGGPKPPDYHICAAKVQQIPILCNIITRKINIHTSKPCATWGVNHADENVDRLFPFGIIALLDTKVLIKISR